MAGALREAVLGKVNKGAKSAWEALLASRPSLRSFTIRKNSALKPATAGRTLVVDAAGLADDLEFGQLGQQLGQCAGWRHRVAVQVLRKAAEIAPAMGLIGTLIGLVQMLRTLDDPSKIGGGMATALAAMYSAISRAPYTA